VVWYTGQFYALFFLGQVLKVDGYTTNILIAWSLLLGSGGFVLFGWLSDKIGRKPIILGGCLVAAITYFPLFGLMTSIANPQLAKALDTVKVQVVADPASCGSVFDPVGIRTFTAPCDVARVALARSAITYQQVSAPAGEPAKVLVNGKEVAIDAAIPKNMAAFTAAASAAGYPKAGDPSIVKVNGFFSALGDPAALKLIVVLTVLVLFVTAVYGPIAAALVEFFPTRIRYTAMSLPYHIGNGWFGGFLPPTAFAMVAATGDIYYGLWYPIVIALATFVIGLLFVPETKDRDIFTYGAEKR
jgi:Sugar (and other) transporter